jgi:uncharacterized cupredoxin-like copper-binding protein
MMLAVVVPVMIGACGRAMTEGSKSTGSAEAVAATQTIQSQSTATVQGRIKVSLSEWSVHASRSKAKAGKVVFTVTNIGTVTHEMVVIRTAKVASRLAHGGEASEEGSVGEVSDLGPGQTKAVSLHLKRGHYALICNEPGHYMSGMHTDFIVE